MEFPIYRKYNGIDVWFKITSTTKFSEYKKMGARLLCDDVEAKIFPEKQFIRDMIDCYENRWSIVSETELNRFLNDV